MSGIIEMPRYSCALAGSQYTVHAIEHAIPILHSGPGCAFTNFFGQNFASGLQGSGYAGGLSVPSTNLYEKQIVFGGEEKLREQIKNTIEIINGDLYVVLSGCSAGLIGDDIAAIVREFKGDPAVIHVETSGFRGNSYAGYEYVIEALVKQYLKPGKKIKGLVNILGVVPYQDVFWNGNLQEIKRVLERLGLRVNTLFGDGQGIEAWKKAPCAELNIVLSPWLGQKAAKLLEDRFNIPYLIFPGLPIGVAQTNRLLEEVGTRLKIDKKKIDKVTSSEQKSVYYYFNRVADAITQFDMQLTFAQISDSNYAIGMTKFLVEELGYIPVVNIITDNTPPEFQGSVIDELKTAYLNTGIDPSVHFETDSGRIWDIIKDNSAQLLLGSSLDKDIAGKMHSFHLGVSFPITNRVVLDRGYAGYRGAITLVEDIMGAVVAGL